MGTTARGVIIGMLVAAIAVVIATATRSGLFQPGTLLAKATGGGPEAAGPTPATGAVQTAAAPLADAVTSGRSAAAMPLDLYLRRWQGIPPDVQIEIGPARPSPVPGLEVVPVTLSRNGQTQQVELFRSADGRHLIPQLLDLAVDPHAPLAARINLAERPALGPTRAPVTVVEYSSFQCPYCRQLAHAVKQTMRGPLGKEVRWVYKHFPLSSQPWSEPAAVAAECARSIGGDDKFWALHDLYFGQQDTFTPQNHRERAVAWARQVRLPVERFENCLDNQAARRRVQEDYNEGRMIGVSSTPTLVINGRLAPGAVSAEALAAILEQELAYRRALARTSPGSR